MKDGIEAPPAAVSPVGVPLRRYLYATAGVSGAAVMIVEILGARMLAPYMGTSHFVWVGQIAATLLALSCGYWLGGWMADRSRSLALLYGCLLLAAFHLGLTVLFLDPLAYWCLEFPLSWGSLLASLILFFPPLVLLAVAGPFLVRVLALSLDSVGGQAGRLSAVGALGSVAGTFLIGYVAIPLLPNSVLMYATSAALATLAAGYFTAWGRASVGGAGLAAVLAAGGFGTARDLRAEYAGGEEIFRANSHFGRLQVIKLAGGDLVYLNDYLPQDGYNPLHKRSMFGATYLVHDLARAYGGKLESALCLGVGTGAVPMQLAAEGVRVDAVEINPAVVPMAEKYFDFDRSRVNLHIADGRPWLNSAKGRFDAVLVDAFLDHGPPWHLMTRESFQTMHRVMTPGGVMVMNTCCDLGRGRDFFAASLAKTLKSVFRNVRIHGRPGDNTYFVASDREPLEMGGFQPDLPDVHPFCRDEVAAGFLAVVKGDLQGGVLLTDDYNPADFHDAVNREKQRKKLALLMRRR